MESIAVLGVQILVYPEDKNPVGSNISKPCQHGNYRLQINLGYTHSINISCLLPHM